MGGIVKKPNVVTNEAEDEQFEFDSSIIQATEHSEYLDGGAYNTRINRTLYESSTSLTEYE